MKGIPGMGNIMKQAQQFQTKMAKLQEELVENPIQSHLESPSIEA